MNEFTRTLGVIQNWKGQGDYEGREHGQKGSSDDGQFYHHLGLISRCLASYGINVKNLFHLTLEIKEDVPVHD